MNLTTRLPRVGSFYLLSIAWVPILGAFVAMRALRLIRCEIERHGIACRHHLTHVAVGFFYYLNFLICITLVILGFLCFIFFIFDIGGWGSPSRIERLLGRPPCQVDSTFDFLYENYPDDMRLFYHHKSQLFGASEKIEVFQFNQVPPMGFHQLKMKCTGATFTLRDYHLNNVVGADSIWREFTEGKSAFRKGYCPSPDSSRYEIILIRAQ